MKLKRYLVCPYCGRLLGWRWVWEAWLGIEFERLVPGACPWAFEVRWLVRPNPTE